MTLKAGDRTRYLNVVQGTDNFFNVFGVRPLLGRTFAAGEDQPGKNNVVVLSYEVWKQSFNGDSGALINLYPYQDANRIVQMAFSDKHGIRGFMAVNAHDLVTVQKNSLVEVR